MAAQDTMRREAGAMKDEARAMWDDATDVARSAASQQQRAAAQGIDNFAGALRAAARNTDGGNGASSRVAQTVADGLDRVSSSLKGRDLNSLIRDVEDFARSQPLVFFGAALATGFVAMRFLKSSTPDDGTRYREVSSSTSSRPMQGAHGATTMQERSAAAGGGSSAGSALADPDAMQRGVGTRPDATRQSHAAEFESNAGVMAEHDGGFARSDPPTASDSPVSSTASRGDTAHSGSAGPGIWPRSGPTDPDTKPGDPQSRSGR